MRPMRLYRLLFIMLAGFASLPSQAATQAYVSGYNHLYRLDLDTAKATPIGNGIGFNDVEGLAFSPAGVLYGIADGTQGNGSELTDFLIRIDPGTGKGTLIRHLAELKGLGPNGQLDYGLAFTCDGRLWASSDTTGRLWEINPETGSVREVADLRVPLSDITARGNELYGIGVTNGFSDASHQALYRINPADASIERIGSLNVADALSSSGADFDADGTLWATLDSQPPDVERPSRLSKINVKTGQASVIGSISGIRDNISVRAMAISTPGACSANAGDNSMTAGNIHPVPGPSLPMLLVLGVITAISGRRYALAAH